MSLPQRLGLRLRVSCETLRNPSGSEGTISSATFARLSARNAEPAAGNRGIVIANNPSAMKLSLRTIIAGGALAALAAFAFAAPAAENWENHCAKCHGADGKGQTKAGRKLNVKDYTDAKVQAEMKDEEMIKATADGVNDKNGKERMKAYKEELSPAEIKDLIGYVRQIKK